MISSQKKAVLVGQHGGSKSDVGSSAVQIAIFTARIEEVNQHLKTAKKDKMARRGLLQLVGKRRRLLNYLARKDESHYQKLIKQLKLRK